MKYEVGDKVRVREDLKLGEIYGGCRFVVGMLNLCGKIAHITEVNKRAGGYCIDSGLYYWTDEMLEDVDMEVQEMNKKLKHKVGDKVRIRRDLSEDIEFVNKKMLSYAGKLATITRTYYPKKVYGVDIDEGDWFWRDSMFENADTEKQKMNKHVVIDVCGNKVVAYRGNKIGIARCHPSDDFDFYVGAKIALERLEEAEKQYGWLKVGMKYYIPSVVYKRLYEVYTYGTYTFDDPSIERGIAFRTKEEAIECAKKMLTAVKQEG